MKYALIIANNQYNDPGLARLNTPAADAQALADVFRDRNIGSFDKVLPLINKTESQVSRAISNFLSDKRPEDLVVIYFSGHGVLDDRGRLFLALKDTRVKLLKSTAISATFVSEEMDSCRSRRQVLILDCCNSGAFARGTKGEQKAVTEATFEGSGFGRAVLTASDSTQYALEGDQVIQTNLSLFTHFLLEGLKTGKADLNNDGHISLDEWYDYTYTNVLATTPKQIPNKWSYRQQGDLIIAKNPFVKKKVVALPSELLQLLDSHYVGAKEVAIKELGILLHSHDSELATLARLTLEKLRVDDSRIVSRAAMKELSEPEPQIKEDDLALEKAAREQAKRETTEKAVQEKAERGRAAQAKLELELAETASREQTEREAAERAAQEKTEREQAVQGKLALKLAEKANIEKAERDATETAERERAERLRFETAQRDKGEKTKQKRLYLVFAGIVGIVGMLIVSLRGGSWPFPQIFPSQSAPTESASILTPNAPSASQRDIADHVDDFGIAMRLIPTTQTLDSFYLDKYEVSNEEYKMCEACDPPINKDAFQDPRFAKHPVVYVTWDMAKQFCEWRGARLPKIPEWKLAAYGPEIRALPWGDQFGCDRANYGGCVSKTREVDAYKGGASYYSVYNMVGNVWEWVDGVYQNLDSYHVTLGGSFKSALSDIKTEKGISDFDVYSGTIDDVGFRCARDADP